MTPKYKQGKILELLSFQQIQEKVTAAKGRVNREALAYFWLLYYVGCRKSELYERTVRECQITETNFILEITRKKGSEQTPPIRLPLWFPGMNIVCEQLEKARSYKKKKKLIERYHKGERITTRIRDRWLFPHVAARWAQIIIKEILGSQYYPHFLRLNRITELCSDKDVTISMIKSYTGIRSLKTIQKYIGTSKKEQKKAVDFMAKQIRDSQQKDPEEK